MLIQTQALTNGVSRKLSQTWHRCQRFAVLTYDVDSLHKRK